jgi:subfamily B ATP-binding cassette protein MsbA
MTEIQLFRRLMTWIAPYWTMFAFAISSLIAIALTTSLLPLLIKQLLDSVLNSKNDLEGFQFALLTILGLLIIRSIASFSSSYAINWISGKVGMDLRETLFEKLLALPVSYPEQHDSDKLNAYFFSNIDQITDGIAQILAILVKEIFIVIGLLIVMLCVNWEFSLMELLIMLAIGSIMQFVSQVNDSNQRTPHPSMGSPLLSLTSIKHIKSIKLDGSQSQESQHFCNSIEHQRNLILKQAAIKTFSRTIALIIITTLLAAFFFLFKQQLNLHMITAGDTGALIIAALMLVVPIRRLLNMQLSLQNRFQVIHHIDSLLTQQNESDSGSVEIARTRGQLRFEEVSVYNYSQTCLPLFNLTLTIQPGEIVALASSSDGQERTLTDLIARFIHPSEGRILLDNIDIATIKLTDLRANIAWLTPDTKLLNDTIAANIAYGTTRCATEASIIKVARTCHVTKFARGMPYGLQTRIDTKDIELSENQRQCILIARALLKNPAIVIIDETTAVFNTHCALVDDALDNLIRNRTTLIISPRATMLEKAHRILELA